MYLCGAIIIRAEVSVRPPGRGTQGGSAATFASALVEL